MENIPPNLRYTKDHEWASQKGDRFVVGITAFAVEQLGDITLVELPPVGTKLERGKAFGVVESVKSVSDLYAPMSGTVRSINQALVDKPELLNQGAYEAWMIELEASTPAHWDDLLDAKAYGQIVAEASH